MRMVLHALSDNIGDFMELAVVYFKQCVENAALYRLESVLKLRNCTVANDVACVFDEVLVKNIFYKCHFNFPTLCVYICGQMFFDELASFRRVLSHIERKQRRHVLERLHFDGRKMHRVRCNELSELARVDFSESLESCHLDACAKLFDCLVAFRLAVAINRFLLITRAEKSSLKNVDTSARHKLLEEAKEECEYEVSNRIIRIRRMSTFGCPETCSSVALNLSTAPKK